MAAPRVPPNPNMVHIDASHVVVVGGGPAGLAIAVRLKQLGFDNVTVIDPRLGNRKRNSDLVKEVFDEISKLIAPLTVKPSHGSHIKDVERQLEVHAERLKILMIKGKFVGFDTNKKIIIKDEMDREVSLYAQVVFDATGTKRVVMERFNNDIQLGKLDAQPFTTSDLFEKFSGKKMYGNKAYGRVQTIGYPDRNFNYLGLDITNPITYALGMEELRELGWKEDYFPWHIAKAGFKKNSLQSKINYYFEIPSNLIEENDIVNFLKIILKIVNNEDPNFPQELEMRSPKQKRVNGFTVNPQFVNEVMYKGNANYPVIIPVGDAKTNFPFFTGQSIIFGIKWLHQILNAFANNILSVDLSQLNTSQEKEFGDGVQKFMAVDAIFEGYRTNTIQQAPKLYLQAWEQGDAEVKHKIKSGLLLMIPGLATFLLKEWQNQYDILLESTKDKSIPSPGLIKEVVLLTTKLIENFQELEEVLSVEEREQYYDAMKTAGKKFKEIGTEFYLQRRFNTALTFYESSLRLFANFPRNEFLTTKLALYSNIIIAANEFKKYETAIKRFEEFVINLLPIIDLDDPNNKRVFEKINYQTAKAMISYVKGLLEESNFDRQHVLDMMGKIEQLIANANPEKQQELRENLLSITSKVRIKNIFKVSELETKPESKENSYQEWAAQLSKLQEIAKFPDDIIIKHYSRFPFESWWEDTQYLLNKQLQGRGNLLKNKIEEIKFIGRILTKEQPNKKADAYLQKLLAFKPVARHSAVGASIYSQPPKLNPEPAASNSQARDISSSLEHKK